MSLLLLLLLLLLLYSRQENELVMCGGAVSQNTSHVVFSLNVLLYRIWNTSDNRLRW